VGAAFVSATAFVDAELFAVGELAQFNNPKTNAATNKIIKICFIKTYKK